MHSNRIRRRAAVLPRGDGNLAGCSAVANAAAMKAPYRVQANVARILSRHFEVRRHCVRGRESANPASLAMAACALLARFAGTAMTADKAACRMPAERQRSAANPAPAAHFRSELSPPPKPLPTLCASSPIEGPVRELGLLGEKGSGTESGHPSAGPDRDAAETQSPGLIAWMVS